jgi:ATP-dependent DNA helicase RecG
MSKFTTEKKPEKSSPKSSVKRSGKIAPKKLPNSWPKKAKKKRGRFGEIIEEKRDENRAVRRVDRRGEKLSKNRQKILDTFRDDPTVSSAQLVEIVGTGSTNIEKDLRYLKGNGWIGRVGSAKDGHWKIINE